MSGSIASADERVALDKNQATRVDAFQGKARVFILTD
jgi:hypothetical protein